jgi:hypothetical protein
MLDPRGWTTCVIPPVGMRATETAVRSDPDERMPQRGVYGGGLDTCCMVEVDPERFEVMVSEALGGRGPRPPATRFIEAAPLARSRTRKITARSPVSSARVINRALGHALP